MPGLCPGFFCLIFIEKNQITNLIKRSGNIHITITNGREGTKAKADQY